ncbi:MAG: 4'-phosphopantetheinyl transferase family protein [Nitrospirales bacterium]
MITTPHNHENAWNSPPQDITLPPDHVHIWKANLSPPQPQLAHLQTILSADEQARAQRFRFSKHRKAFVTARGLLRLILSRYLNTSPRALSFAQEAHGKPYLLSPTTPPFSFNISHSNDMALFAVTLKNLVGIDIEYHRKKVNVPSLIQRICSTEEKEILMALSPTEQKRGFFACWTRKEAYVKATGKGITIPFTTITVSLPPSPCVELRHIEDDEDISLWTLSDIQVSPRYTAALAIKGGNDTTAYWAWEWDTHDTGQNSTN